MSSETKDGKVKDKKKGMAGPGDKDDGTTKLGGPGGQTSPKTSQPGKS
jgi:hypothetical protein